MSLSDEIRERLNAALSPSLLEIQDDSHLHASHAGNKSGGGYFSVTIVATKFTGCSILERQRMVYDALGPLLQGAIHALSIKAEAP